MTATFLQGELHDRHLPVGSRFLCPHRPVPGPDFVQKDTKVPAGRQVRVPAEAAKFCLRVGPPYGNEVLLAVVARAPLAVQGVEVENLGNKEATEIDFAQVRQPHAMLASGEEGDYGGGNSGPVLLHCFELPEHITPSGRGLTRHGAKPAALSYSRPRSKSSTQQPRTWGPGPRQWSSTSPLAHPASSSASAKIGIRSKARSS